MSDLAFRVLGPIEAVTNGRALVLGGSTIVDLLAMLVVSPNQIVATEALIDAVWYRQTPQYPRATLQSAVARLRKVIGPDVIETLPSGYRFHADPDSLDLLKYEQLEAAAGQQRAEDALRLLTEAIGLFRGVPLENVTAPALLNNEAPRLTRLYLDTCEKWAELALRLGRSEMVASRLAALVDEHPFRERMAGQLILGLYRSGRQAEAIAAYESLRRELSGEMGIDPSREVQELHLRILRADPSLHAELDAAAPTAPQTAHEAEPPVLDSALFARRAGPGEVPHQLPADTRVFTGRQGELMRLLALADNMGNKDPGTATVVISAIDGMPGIGKTTLAVHAAHLLADRFDDGQLFIDLHGYTDGYRPRTAAQALETLLRALGVPPRQIPDDAEERATLYRERLARTRTLIVLDNAVDEAQVRPLIPGGAECLVLVTSRRKLKGLDDAHCVSLDVLPGWEAVALFCAVAGPRAAANDPVVAEIAELCGRLPLAVRIAAALMRSRPAWNPGHLASRLRDESSKLNSLADGDRNLTALFDLSGQALGHQQQRLYRYLGLVPGPELDRYAAAALLDADPRETEQLMQGLVDHNLLQECTVGRYRMHDLIRACTRSLAIPALERGRAIDRLLTYYQHIAGQADAQMVSYHQPGPVGPPPAHAPALLDSAAARVWLRTERPNLMACLDLVIRAEQDERIIAFARGLSGLLRAEGPWPDAIAAHTAAVAAAARSADWLGQADALSELGTLRRLTSDYPEAEVNLHAALKLYAKTGSQRGQAWSKSELGVVKRLLSDHRRAEVDLQAGLTIWRTLGDASGQAYCLINLAIVRSNSGDMAAAERILLEALTLYQEVGDQSGQARCLTELARMQNLTGCYHGARKDARAAVEICQALGDWLGRANARVVLGKALQMTGDYDDAARCQMTALDEYRKLGDRMGQANARTLLAEVRSLTGDHEGAERDLETSIRTFHDLGNRGNQAYAMNRYAAAITAGGDRDRAIKVYLDAVRLAREVQQPDDEAAALHGLGENYLRTGRLHDGTVHLRHALEIYERLGVPDAAQVAALLAEMPAGPGSVLPRLLRPAGDAGGEKGFRCRAVLLAVINRGSHTTVR